MKRYHTRGLVMTVVKMAMRTSCRRGRGGGGNDQGGYEGEAVVNKLQRGEERDGGGHNDQGGYEGEAGVRLGSPSCRGGTTGRGGA